MVDAPGGSAAMLLGLFGLAVLAIVFAGTRLAAVADELADRTGLGEAIFGAVFIGASTSLPGITVSFVAGLDGAPELAAANALGGVVAQTAFLAFADIAYARANLEHAAASTQNLVQTALLILLLGIVLLGTQVPELTLWRVHPITVVLVGAYIAGFYLLKTERDQPMWIPRKTHLTREDTPEPPSPATTVSLWLRFAVYVPVLLLGGLVIERTAAEMAVLFGMTSSITGALVTAVPTSLPELVIAVAAVRRGALTLAVGNILGGNAFDMLFIAAADVGYGAGSVYHDAGPSMILLAAMSLLMTTSVLLGFLRRQKSGPANIGFETWLVLIGAATTYALLFVTR